MCSKITLEDQRSSRRGHHVTLAGLRWFGVVRYIGNERTEGWVDFYRELFGFQPLAEETAFGILPKGQVLSSPCGSFHLQLIEPEPGILDVWDDEHYTRVAFGTPDVRAAVNLLKSRGMEFHESERVHTDERGALTKPVMHGLSFELVRKA